MHVVNIEVASGINEKFDPFCHIVVALSDGSQAKGQLTPDEVRTLALQWLEGAEAAEHDAAVAQLLSREFDLEIEAVAAFLGALRGERLRADVPSPLGTIERGESLTRVPGDITDAQTQDL